LQTFAENYYAEASDLPKEIFVEYNIPDGKLIGELLKNRSGKNVKISVPTRGKKLQLINLGVTNAQEFLRKWQSTQGSNLDAAKAALDQLREVLKLSTTPGRIEGYDISNIQGTNPVGSMVVAKDGLPAKNQYRKFKINVKNTPDDFAMMEEMLTRRLAKVNDPEFEAKWPKPDLLVIDGGKGQLGVAVQVLENFDLKIPVIGLAKRIEEIFLPHNPTPIVLDHSEPALQLLQRLRDEAHRFAVSYHTSVRDKRVRASVLDGVPGVGPTTRKKLIRAFGSVAGVKQAGLPELSAIVGAAKARVIKEYI
jgi:excinuclease ABC subunit C